MHKSIITKTAVVLVALLIIIQFFRPAKNQTSVIASHSINIYPASPVVGTALKTACYDCHSNNTTYPWYASIQPVYWYLDNHIKNGKRHLNFDDFATYPLKKQDKKLDKISKSLSEGWMPMSSYTLIHRNAILTQQQKDSLISWVNATRKIVQAKLADSLHQAGK